MVYTYVASFLALLSHNKEGAVSERSKVVNGGGLSLRSGRRSAKVTLPVQHLWSFGLYGDSRHLEALFQRGSSLCLILGVKIYVTKTPATIPMYMYFTYNASYNSIILVTTRKL